MLGGHRGTAVALGGAVEDPGVHGRHGAVPGRLGGGERHVVLVPGGVVLGVQMQRPGGTLLAGREHARQPGVDLLGGGAVGVGVRSRGELVDLVAQRHAEEARPAGEGGGERAEIGRLAVEHLGVGEQIAPVPGAGPGREVVEAAQVPLQPVHVDVEPALGGRVHQPYQVLDGTGADQGAVGLEVGPEREHPDVVGAQRRDGVQVRPYGVQVEVEPVVEPPFARGVVDAEAHGSRHRHTCPWTRGRRKECAEVGGQPLTAPSPTPRKKYRWRQANRTISGATAMMVPAATRRSSLAKVPCR